MRLVKLSSMFGASPTIVYLVVCSSAGGRYRRMALVFSVAERKELSMHSFSVSLRARYVGRLNSKSQELCFSKSLFDLLSQSSDLQATVLTVTLWHIWKEHIWEERNEARNTEVKPNPNHTSLKILAYVDLIRHHL
jgi:hypothetical protein